MGCNNSNTPVQTGLTGLPLLDNTETRSISAENMTGEKGKGGMAIPNPSETKPAASARAADDLGQGWKVKPFLRVNSQVVTVNPQNALNCYWPIPFRHGFAISSALIGTVTGALIS
jgi:hypothetical protein